MNNSLHLCKKCQDIKKKKLRCCEEKTISLGSRKTAEFISKIPREDRLYVLVNFVKDGHIEVLSLPSKYKKLAQRINLHEVIREPWRPSRKTIFERSERYRRVKILPKVELLERTAKLIIDYVLSVNFS